MKSHRVLGPVSIALGSVNVIVGFAWVGLRGAIVGYVMFTLAASAIIAGVVFIRMKSKRRREAMNSNAAHNFREEYGQNVPMQPMGPQHGRVEYYNVQPNK